MFHHRANVTVTHMHFVYFRSKYPLYFPEHPVYNLRSIANTHAVQECNMNYSPTLNEIHCTIPGAVDGT